MPTETYSVEGEVREAEPIRTVVVAQPGQAIVAADTPTGPTDMIARAAVLATALAAMVEAQNLYTNINGKKFPNVEAWQTIGRMDNVVAREAERPVRNDDGSWEAFVELVRLSDGMVIGNGSALCGAERDGQWTRRPDHEKRSMAVTRATSRAFRQQYSWIMALAGYQPTPAEEMPTGDDEPEKAALEPHLDGSLIGKVARGKSPVDYELRQTPDGLMCGFALTEGRQKLQVVAVGPLGEALAPWLPQLTDSTVKVWGSIGMVDWDKGGKKMPPYRRVTLERIETPDFILPAPASGPFEPVAPGQETLPLSDEEKAAIAGRLGA